MQTPVGRSGIEPEKYIEKYSQRARARESHVREYLIECRRIRCRSSGAYLCTINFTLLYAIVLFPIERPAAIASHCIASRECAYLFVELLCFVLFYSSLLYSSLYSSFLFSTLLVSCFFFSRYSILNLSSVVTSARATAACRPDFLPLGY